MFAVVVSLVFFAITHELFTSFFSGRKKVQGNGDPQRGLSV